MKSKSFNNTQYVSNYNCSYCGSVNIQYKAKKDTTMLKYKLPYLCRNCWIKMDKRDAQEFYIKI
jgi:DNA-directed RNA polymerase subunit RPC12/RpoP